MASQVYSLGLKGAIVTLSGLGSAEWRQGHPAELHGAIRSQGKTLAVPGK